VKIDERQQKIKIVRTNRQSNLRASCQSIFSLCRHHLTNRQFSQDIGEWPENQILIPDWTPGATLLLKRNPILIPDWTYCPGATLLLKRNTNSDNPHLMHSSTLYIKTNNS